MKEATLTKSMPSAPADDLLDTEARKKKLKKTARQEEIGEASAPEGRLAYL